MIPNFFGIFEGYSPWNHNPKVNLDFSSISFFFICHSFLLTFYRFRACYDTIFYQHIILNCIFLIQSSGRHNISGYVQVRKQSYISGNSVPRANLGVLDKLIAARHELAQVIFLVVFLVFFLISFLKSMCFIKTIDTSSTCEMSCSLIFLGMCLVLDAGQYEPQINMEL